MGGSKPTVIQTPTTPAPSASESAESIYRARLQYDPQVAALEYAMAQQYAPLYGALYTQTAQAQFPGIEQLRQAGTEQALQRFQNPFGYTPEEQSALDAMRQRVREQTTKNIRERQNLGGGLYSGRGQTQEMRALNELEQAFIESDIQRKIQGGQLATQQAIPLMQILYPQIQQTPAVSQPVTPSAETLYNALYQSSQPNYLYQQGQPSPAWGLAGSLAGGIGAGWANKFFK